MPIVGGSRTIVGGAGKPATVQPGGKPPIGGLSAEQLEQGTAGRIAIQQGAGTNTAWKAMSGDVTIGATGATVIGAEKVLASMVERGASGRVLTQKGVGSATSWEAPAAPAYQQFTPAAPVSGTVLAQGYCTPLCSSDPGVAPPGYAGFSGSEAAATMQLFGLLGPNGRTASCPRGIAGRGLTVSIKGFFQARTAAAINALFENVAFGIAIAGATVTTATLAATVAAILETTRDDTAAVALTVDSLNNVKRYNNASAGDASYTDPVPGATTKDPTTGFSFEIIVVMPAAGNSTDDATVTLKIDGVTMYSAAPVAATGGVMIPFLLVNCDGEATQLLYEVKET